jgi:hypothetical protein
LSNHIFILLSGLSPARPTGTATKPSSSKAVGQPLYTNVEQHYEQNPPLSRSQMPWTTLQVVDALTLPALDS